jgi:hypothetical protein
MDGFDWRNWCAAMTPWTRHAPRRLLTCWTVPGAVVQPARTRARRTRPSARRSPLGAQHSGESMRITSSAARPTNLVERARRKVPGTIFPRLTGTRMHVDATMPQGRSPFRRLSRRLVPTERLTLRRETDRLISSGTISGVPSLGKVPGTLSGTLSGASHTEMCR